MKWTLLLLSLFWLNLGFCQKIALKDAISDLEFLNHAVVEGHPVNYEPGHPVNITSVLEKVKTFKEDSISDRAFRQLLKEAFYEIGCIHTSRHLGKLSKKEWKRRTQNKGVGLDYFPIDLASSAGRIYAIKQGRTGSPELEGIELAAINGVAVPDLLRELYKNGASDGGGDAFSKFYLKQTALSWLIAGHFDYPSEYKVDFKNGQKVAVETVHFSQAPFDSPVAPCRTLGMGKANALCTEGPIMVCASQIFQKRMYVSFAKHSGKSESTLKSRSCSTFATTLAATARPQSN